MKYLYVKTTLDKYELPIAVADSPTELARLPGTTPGTVNTSISKGIKGWFRIEVDNENLQ